MTRISGKRIIITGGAGFIGSHLVDRLCTDNEVTVFDNLHRDALRFSENHHNPAVTFVRGDVLDLAQLQHAMAGQDICIHAAAIAGIYSVGQSLIRTMRVNLLGTVNALDAAVATGVKRFIDFSTSEVYGPFVYRGKETDRLSLGPTGERRWIYAISKLAGEHFAHAYSVDHGLSVVSVRPFNIYGPRQVGEGAIQQMVLRALRGDDITIYNDGTQIRSWCYVSDFVDGVIGALEMSSDGQETFNIGNPQATTTVLGLAQTIIRLTDSTSKLVFKPHPGPEVEMRVPDIGKATEMMGYTPAVGLDDGLHRTIDWYREHLGDL